jgi:hypothetical protein
LCSTSLSREPARFLPGRPLDLDGEAVATGFTLVADDRTSLSA